MVLNYNYYLKMSKFPIIFGIVGKKLYLTILLALIIILNNIRNKISEGNNVSLINSFIGEVFLD